ncbi:hypothetical protein PC116_g17165 [Phytophthora cactorum]|uniref:Uncharacterized protein n=1 Tax=Phytophthora cactorum TaxID=29920 RepID=A0A8T1CU77_9STRA|nr:hypothetical protein Pcac1_g21635 [Phytophthora cactorum]KAG2766982.1 hypothetical protein Pcac1_g21637 [Phytophthora cactorum]KAG2766983.1 hypothetical protein Pcac1_g21636 [Phytophthora cactorum]KAG2766984.1 hypothetical protein Pcac1_g21639 [Phytophthora cactorum]KAG2766985.1 hypothetical protein Pcac1_g21638 [Phytophthora cactorum]
MLLRAINASFDADRCSRLLAMLLQSLKPLSTTATGRVNQKPDMCLATLLY